MIGDNFRCHAYTGIGRGIYFIGLEEDVEIAKEVYLYALNTMLCLAREYILREKTHHYRYNRGLKNDYLNGFITGLRAKYKEQVESKGYALALVKDELVVQAVKAKKFKKSLRSNLILGLSRSAYETGYKDGRSFDDNKKMIR